MSTETALSGPRGQAAGDLRRPREGSGGALRLPFSAR